MSSLRKKVKTLITNIRNERGDISTDPTNFTIRNIINNVKLVNPKT